MYKEDCYIENPMVTHKILVACPKANEFDSRTFSIRTTEPTIFLLKEIKTMLDAFVIQESEKIEFVCDKDKNSHMIQVKERKGRTYTFHITLSSYSATEIADIIFSFLCRGRVKEWKPKKSDEITHE